MSTTTLTDAPTDGYLAGETAETFDWRVYMASVLPEVRDEGGAKIGPADLLEKVPEVRRLATKQDPLLFALVYMPHLLKADPSMPAKEQGNITFAELHLALYRYARGWTRRAEPRENRDAFIAPRNCGKSTVLFLILPMWAMAHGHLNFIAAFSSAGQQATKHLAAFKNELDSNPMLRHDFPDLCQPMKRAGGQSVSDTQKMYFSKSRQTFFAAGLDEEVLGLTDPMKRRPELLILDDVEPDESNYSLHQAQKRMVSIRDTILPMNESAHVALVGTVTMLGSLVHQLIQTVTAKEAPAEWIETEQFKVHYFPPIIDGVRSIWPAKWPMEYLLAHQHERSYMKNFENQPIPEGSGFWQLDSFHYGTFQCVKTLIQIDPATTKTATSDFYGIAVIGWKPEVREDDRVVEPARCLVRYARAFRCTPAELRRRVVDLVTIFYDVGRVRIEVNQGGDTWREILKDLPVRLLVHNESVKKEVRAQDLLTWYERNQVWHEGKLPEAELQLLAFPNVIHDDLVDAIGAGVRFFLEKKQVQRRIKNRSYV